ncbi:hypothetical protein JMJ78_0005775 [Colletotrichum scovillei]|nr:hypothetical protein JMJ78_0005775 [Colletotrichum scovillei]
MPRAHALALACDDRASMRPGSRLLEVGKPLGPSLHLHFTAGRNTRHAVGPCSSMIDAGPSNIYTTALVHRSARHTKPTPFFDQYR